MYTQAYKSKILPDEKIKALEDLGFDFTIKREKKDMTGKVKKTIWESRFEELEAYKDKFGDLNVPDEYEPNPALAGWKSKFILSIMCSGFVTILISDVLFAIIDFIRASA